MTAAVLVLVLVSLSMLLQLRWTRQFLSVFRPQEIADEMLANPPRVLVVLSLRGADPFLKHCLAGLFRLDYPNHQIRIVVDSRQDSAWRVVEQCLAELPSDHVTLVELQTPLGTCGLRTNALLQHVVDLDASYDVVAWLDADIIPYPRWLWDLVAPFSDPGVGAVSGLRWYVPAFSNPGTLIRTTWNTAGTVQMVASGMAFGGSLAYRAELFRRREVTESWSQILWEDVHTRDLVESQGFRLVFNGAATMPTRERISLASCRRFITRQMLNVRLYHKSWTFLLWLSIWNSLAPLIAIGLIWYGHSAGDRQMASVAGLSLVIYVFGLMYSCLSGGYQVRRMVAARGEPSWLAPWGITPAVIATPFVYVACILQAAIARRVDWRGITYVVRGPRSISMLKHTPFQPAGDPGNQAESI